MNLGVGNTNSKHPDQSKALHDLTAFPTVLGSPTTVFHTPGMLRIPPTLCLLLKHGMNLPPDTLLNAYFSYLIICFFIAGLCCCCCCLAHFCVTSNWL